MEGWDAPPQTPSPGTPPAPFPPQAATPSSDDRTWGLLVHLAALSVFITGVGWILGPLVIWLIKKDASRFVDDQGKEALNFQLTMILALVAAGVVAMIGAILSVILIGLPILILAFLAMSAIVVIAMVYAIVAGVKANQGIWYRYPMTYRFIR